MKKLCFLPFFLIAVGCSPIKSSPYGDGFQLELALHEVKTNLEDLRHDLNSHLADLEIFDARVKHYEGILSQLKTIDFLEEKRKLEKVIASVQLLEKQWVSTEKVKTAESDELRQLVLHAKEITAALGQCKTRIEELEKELNAGQRKFEEVAKLKGSIETLTKTLRGKSHKVQSGDSLEKIAKLNKTSVDKLKKLNKMDNDLIVVGQELQIPSE